MSNSVSGGSADQSKSLGRRFVGGHDPARPEIAGPAPAVDPSFRWAESATARNRPSLAAITSNALVPMLPVEPNTATFFVAADIRPIVGVR